ncbi:hypothetical protein FPANT_466 [Fusarium pseudoanthophilum]|uniref:Uncharacterized protein n=1 Tax=Fusarium pseudoanthophilum TaxID=48495 RepID=A0A8H5Q5P5_9HYPO|nr:hypothetical protein FPANT_466 [Fusarium pseudoanthophilum]
MSAQTRKDAVGTRGYNDAHGESAYSTMRMMDEILLFSKKSYQEFTSNPKATIGSVKLADLKSLVEHEGSFAKLTASRTCTALAIRASTALTRQYPGVYDFRIWRPDSSAEVRMGKQNRIIGVINHIEYKDGLVSCLQAVAKDTKLITLFRFTDNKNRWTKGLMKWYLRGDDSEGKPVHRYLVLRNQKIVEEKDEDKQIQRIVWREGLPGYEDEIGTAASESQCEEALDRFVLERGKQDQWKADDCELIHKRIWEGLVKNYGHPVWKKG